MKELEVIGFDADDTLWVNETYYRDTEEAYARLLSDYADRETVMRTLFATEMSNLSKYGYGIKSFVLSMVENGISISEGNISTTSIQAIIKLGKEMLEKPIELLPDVKAVLDQLRGKYKLIVATKGDLLDQERKLLRSSLSSYFHHIEIMSDKQPENYRRLLHHLDLEPEKFVMIGNSLKSDIMPPLELGSYGIYVPYHTTWEHEKVDKKPDNEKFFEVGGLLEILDLLKN
jgi:putative hydrolase of the HAD superfamily